MNRVYLSLGSNEGDRIGWLRQSLQMLAEKCGAIVAISHIYQTAAWGLPDQPDFLNMAVAVDTELSAADVLSKIRLIEEALKRQRTIKWGQRTLDIDILFFNDEVIDTAELQVPHPHLHKRMFVLVPLADFAPDYLHPVLKKTVLQLLAECPDPLPVTMIDQKL
ncbi:MAG: 2-amino-4-hydroxy-6-hydroxymethyldihydropteridine diphosphokinase [Sphingobacteriales bacterium]|nr:MAG: 2-amino-4-hydroxy-6-hydroxymethyldihydropteridine diphosphokinase [Sphingobacteriales bacterium]